MQRCSPVWTFHWIKSWNNGWKPLLAWFSLWSIFFLGYFLLATMRNGDFTILFVIAALMGPRSVFDCLWSEIAGGTLDLHYLTFHAVSWPAPCDKGIALHTNSLNKILIYFDVCTEIFVVLPLLSIHISMVQYLRCVTRKVTGIGFKRTKLSMI